jgi:hypothetical protein
MVKLGKTTRFLKVIGIQYHVNRFGASIWRKLVTLDLLIIWYSPGHSGHFATSHALITQSVSVFCHTLRAHGPYGHERMVCQSEWRKRALDSVI